MQTAQNVEQLDLFAMPAAPQIITPQKSIIIRRAEENDLSDVQDFIGKPLDTSNFVVMEEDGVQILGVCGWDVLDGFALLHQPVIVEMPESYGWYRFELLRLTAALAEHKTDIEWSVYTFVSEQDVPFLRKYGYKEVEDLPDGLTADKGRLMVKGNRAMYELMERFKNIGIGRVAKMQRR